MVSLTATMRGITIPIPIPDVKSEPQKGDITYLRPPGLPVPQARPPNAQTIQSFFLSCTGPLLWGGVGWVCCKNSGPSSFVTLQAKVAAGQANVWLTGQCLWRIQMEAGLGGS